VLPLRITGPGAAATELEHRAAERLALFPGQDPRQLFRIAVDDFGDLAAHGRTLFVGGLRPGLECRSCGRDCCIELLPAGSGTLRENLFRRRINYGEGLGGRDFFAIDDEPIFRHRNPLSLLVLVRTVDTSEPGRPWIW
jgi:hypothetical protein